MIIGNLSRLISIVGIILLAGAVAWCIQTYGVDFDYIKCLVVSDGICRVGSIGKLFGGAGYNPLIFWIGLACVIAGGILKKFKLL